jgi:hypothetical protein
MSLFGLFTFLLLPRCIKASSLCRKRSETGMLSRLYVMFPGAAKLDAGTTLLLTFYNA